MPWHSVVVMAASTALPPSVNTCSPAGKLYKKSVQAASVRDLWTLHDEYLSQAASKCGLAVSICEKLLCLMMLPSSIVSQQNASGEQAATL